MIEKVVIWTIPEHDFSEWLEKCSGRGTWEEYCERIETAIAAAKQKEKDVITIEISVSRMMQELKNRGLENTPENRAIVAGVLWSKAG